MKNNKREDLPSMHFPENEHFFFPQAPVLAAKRDTVTRHYKNRMAEYRLKEGQDLSLPS